MSWFSVACFWCQIFCDVSPYVCSFYFSSIAVDEWPPFGKKLLFGKPYGFLLYFDYLYIQLFTVLILRA